MRDEAALADARSGGAWLATLAAAATGVQVGATIVATRFVVDDAGPASLALLRYIVGFLCLLPFVLLARRRLRVVRRDLLPIAILGIVQFGCVVAAINLGLKYIPAGRAALVFSASPLMTMLLAAALRHERLTLVKTLGVLLTIAGVGLALGEKAIERGTSPEAWIGELAVLGSAFCAALCSVLYRPYLRRNPALPVGAVAMLASVGFLLLLAAGEGFFDAAPRFSAAGWVAVVLIGVSSGVFYFFWLWALERTTATRVTVFLALSPITAAALGALWLGEAVSTILIGGLVCVVFGLRCAHRDPRKGDYPAVGGPRRR